MNTKSFSGRAWLAVTLMAGLTPAAATAASITLSGTLVSPAPTASDLFGESVSLSNGLALVGATLDEGSVTDSGRAYIYDAASDDTGAMNAGSSYLFDANTGALLQTWNNPTPFLNDMFGSEIALSGTKALIGATQDDGAGFNEGAA